MIGVLAVNTTTTLGVSLSVNRGGSKDVIEGGD